MLALAEDEVRYVASVRALAAHESGRAQTPPRVRDLKEKAQMVIYTFKNYAISARERRGNFRLWRASPRSSIGGSVRTETTAGC